MISFKCQNCGGEMTVERTGDLICAYCGSKAALTDCQLTEYREFRERMLGYLRSLNDGNCGSEDCDFLWASADTVVVRTREGAEITARYLYTAEDGPAVLYLTRSAVLYQFRKQDRGKADLAEQWIGQLEYPPADIKGLNRCFPTLTGRFELEDGGVLLAFAREEQLFPLAVFGALSPEHTAWIVSRMENICCVLEYSGLVHGGISTESVFINPITHEAALIGGWWNTRRKLTSRIPSVNIDLAALRKTADRTLGYNRSCVPEAFTRFLKETPRTDAYDDFARWDRVIEEGFGGRRFVKMNLNDELKL